MARQYLGFDDLGPCVFHGVHKSIDHRPLIFVEEDENREVELDLTGYLESGETISSADITEAGGVTASASVSSPKVTLTLSGVTDEGDFVLTITLSTGRKWRDRVRVRNRRRYTRPELRDYCP